MAALSDNARGALFMMASMTAFTVNDAFMKALSDELPLFQAMFVRSIGVVILLFLLCRQQGQLRFDVGGPDRAMIVLRSTAEVMAAFLFIGALFKMPLANVAAILQVLPLTVTLAGAMVFKEALGWRRILAIIIGFFGVLLIVQPGGADFNAYSFAVLGAVFFVTVRDLAARRLSRDVPSTLVALVAAVFVMTSSGIGSIFVTWQPMSGLAVMQMAAAMFFVIGGYIFSIAAMRVGEIGAVAPFRYTSLLVALILGAAVFGDWPNGLTLIGAVIVVATGLFTLWREGRLKQRELAAK